LYFVKEIVPVSLCVFRAPLRQLVAVCEQTLALMLLCATISRKCAWI
jgi:hypothetical protein